MKSQSVSGIVWRAAAWLVVPAAFIVLTVIDARIADETGRTFGDVVGGADAAAFIVTLLACWSVGIVLTWRVPGNAAGWLFLALGTAIILSGVLDEYAEYTLRAAPGRLPLGELVAVLGDSIFAWWFVLLALCLQFTPTGHVLNARWVPLMWVTIGSAVVYQVGALLRSTPLEGANKGLVSPLAVENLATPIAVVAGIAVAVLGLCLLASVYGIVVRFRRSRDDERRQMLWLVVGVIPLPVCVVLSFAAAYSNHDDDDSAAAWLIAFGVVALAVGVAFSIIKYRLYGVGEVVSKTAAYAIATASVVLTYGVVVVVMTRSIPGVGSGSTLTTVLATLAAAGIALPAYRWARQAIDRRFNRRRFEAVRLVRAGLAAGSPELESLISDALGDPGARILFPGGDDEWVRWDGRRATPGHHVVEVVRRGAPAALLEFDPDRTDRGLVETLVTETAAEIDNLGLRAELARQVQQIRESRARLAGAHATERQRMERDLHDGAQQRLLAIALQLQSARVNGSTEVLHAEAQHAIEQLGVAVQELRDLANGLQPASLASGGLRAAVDDLAVRLPIRLEHDIADVRCPSAVEGAAWFVIAEAVSNAVKYAGVDEVHIRSTIESDRLHVVVVDEGIGGADHRSAGLQGLSDRVAALGGELDVRERAPHGTCVEAVFPCGS